MSLASKDSFAKVRIQSHCIMNIDDRRRYKTRLMLEKLVLEIYIYTLVWVLFWMFVVVVVESVCYKNE